MKRTTPKNKIKYLKSLVRDTPVEEYVLKGIKVLVKREDLSGVNPLPPFSKIRGVTERMIALKKEGVSTVGYTESSVSMAGIAVSAIGNVLGMKTIIFDPQYKKTPGLLAIHRKQWIKNKAVLHPIPAGMVKVNFYISRKLLKEYDEKGILLPLGLPFEETIKQTAIETKKTIKKYKPKSIIVNIGSGTICAGILRESKQIPVYGIMGRSGNTYQKKKQIATKAKICLDGLIKQAELNIVDPGWEYTERSKIKSPFPTHPWYDAKAFEWLLKNIKKLPHPILFWNIGSM